MAADLKLSPFAIATLRDWGYELIDCATCDKQRIAKLGRQICDRCAGEATTIPYSEYKWAGRTRRVA